MKERRQPYDPAFTLTWSALLFVGILIVFVAGIIAAQIYKFGEANTESWAALTGLLGWVQGVTSQIFNTRFGTTMKSEAKDAVIAQQANTAAVVASAAGPPIPPKVETLNVSAEQANVTENPK